jgi:hypothetical protein
MITRVALMLIYLRHRRWLADLGCAGQRTRLAGPHDRRAGRVGRRSRGLSAILFDNWPALAVHNVNARLALTALQIAVGTALLFLGLRALGNALQVWDRDPVELWVTVSNLNFIAATAITHVAVFHRWPVPPARA